MARHVLQYLAMDGRIADHAPVGRTATRFELRLDEGHDRSAGRTEAAHYRPQDQSERDERHVDRGERHPSRQRIGAQVPRVRAFQGDDPWIASERIRQLAPSNVHGVDFRGASLKEDVREPAGRGTDVEADEPCRVDSEGVQCRGELLPATTDELRLLHERHGDRCVHHVAGLAVGPRPVAIADTDLTSHHECLPAAAGGDEAAIHEQLIQSLA